MLERELKHNKFLAITTTIQTILLIIIILLLLFYKCDCGCSPEKEPSSPGQYFDPTIDDDIDYGDRETRPKDEIREELNQKVEAGMMNISMNVNPVFESGTAKGNLLIVNEKINHYAQIIQIYRDDTNELIYTSGAIPVGARLDTDNLDVDLDMGTYECTAHFNQIDDNGNLLGKACAKITIYILS